MKKRRIYKRIVGLGSLCHSVPCFANRIRQRFAPRSPAVPHHRPQPSQSHYSHKSTEIDIFRDKYIYNENPYAILYEHA